MILEINHTVVTLLLERRSTLPPPALDSMDDCRLIGAYGEIAVMRYDIVCGGEENGEER